jgi:hypothetical protein
MTIKSWDVQQHHGNIRLAPHSAINMPFGYHYTPTGVEGVFDREAEALPHFRAFINDMAQRAILTAADRGIAQRVVTDHFHSHQVYLDQMHHILEDLFQNQFVRADSESEGMSFINSHTPLNGAWYPNDVLGRIRYTTLPNGLTLNESRMDVRSQWDEEPRRVQSSMTLTAYAAPPTRRHAIDSSATASNMPVNNRLHTIVGSSSRVQSSTTPDELARSKSHDMQSSTEDAVVDVQMRTQFTWAEEVARRPLRREWLEVPGHFADGPVRPAHEDGPLLPRTTYDPLSSVSRNGAHSSDNSEPNPAHAATARRLEPDPCDDDYIEFRQPLRARNAARIPLDFHREERDPARTYFNRISPTPTQNTDMLDEPLPQFGPFVISEKEAATDEITSPASEYGAWEFSSPRRKPRV